MITIARRLGSRHHLRLASGIVADKMRTSTGFAVLSEDGWEIAENAPKTASGARAVALDAETVKVLRSHRARQLARRLELDEVWIDSGRVFTGDDGSWLHPGKLSEAFERLVKSSGLPSIRLHDLRHGAATLALAGGADLKVVQEMLGHLRGRRQPPRTQAFRQFQYLTSPLSVLPQVTRDT